MIRSPFSYGKTVSAGSFTNREKEYKRLYNNLINGINTTIISPRRWGKSSLVEKVTRDIDKNEVKLKSIIIDFFSSSGEQEFLEIFARKIIKSSSTRVEDWVRTGKELFKKLSPKIHIGTGPDSDFSISFDWNELKQYKDEVLNLGETIALKKKIKIIVCLDEFQRLADFEDYEKLEMMMRATWQRQKNVTYCLFGSKRHMMANIFNNPSKPFYRFGDIIFLDKIAADDWINFILGSFKRTGKEISEINAGRIARLMKNHPWYVQQLSHYTWQNTIKKAGSVEISGALEELISANSPLYQNEVEKLSVTQVNLLKAVNRNEIQLTSVPVMQKYRLGTPRNVFKNKSVLANNDMIQKVDGRFEFLDPAFELWFTRHFHNQN